MNFLMPSVLNLTAAMVCLSLGAMVLIRSWRWRTHQTFAFLCFNLMLWALGVVWVLQARNEEQVIWALRFTEVVPCFIAATFYHFIGHFPRGKFDGNSNLLKIFYCLGIVFAVNALSPWYIQDIELFVDKPPVVKHHDSLILMLIMNVLAIGIGLHDLRRKYKETHGFGRRQIQFVMTGMFCILALAPISAIVDPIFGIQSLQAYGPVSLMLVMGSFAYAMVRYHLLDTRAIVSKLLIYCGATVFVTVAFISALSVFNWVFVDDKIRAPMFPILITSMVISLIFPFVQTRVSHFVEVTLLRQRYDMKHLFTRITSQAAQLSQLDALLRTVADDIRKTIGVRVIRVLLVEPNDRSLIRSVYSSIAEETPIVSRGYTTLLDYLRQRPEALILEKILHRRPDERMVVVARQLAELDAYFCLPLQTADGLVGILTLSQKSTHDIYSEEEQFAFQALAGPLGTAVTNARLYNELEQVHRHQTNVFGQMREGVIAVDMDGCITIANKAACQLMDDVQEGDHMDKLATEVADLLSLTLREEQPISDFETNLTPKEGEAVPVSLSSTCLKDANNRTTGAVALIYDLLLLKRLEHNVQRADRLSSLGVLAAGMAHEIKNPLVSIKTFTHLLLERYMDEDFRTTFRDVVPHEVDRIDAIVSRLLDFARPKPVSFESVDIAVVIKQILALIENQTRKYNVNVALDFPDEELHVYGDEQQLHQVFLNLMLNAVDAMKINGEGDMQISAREGRMHARDSGRMSLDTRCVRVTVTDSGCGISSRQLDDLFTPFYTTKDDGCGLGLAVVHGIVSEHGGEIDVTSEIGKGTSFFVSLRFAEQLEPVEM